jgi:hypothetical protein
VPLQRRELAFSYEYSFIFKQVSDITALCPISLRAAVLCVYQLAEFADKHMLLSIAAKVKPCT